MSVLIKNMKLPKDNPVTINIYRDGSWVNAYTRENGKAIEVPPHGRLIDADALQRVAEEKFNRGLLYVNLDEDAPTIIEAERAEDG